MLRRIGIADGWSARLWVVLALVLGLVIGLVLAWQVFPTRWVDTDPSDLRAEHQADYIAMVADSWTVSGNADLARERLYELVDDDTDWAGVDALVAQTATDLDAKGNGAAALRITRMLDSVPLPVVGEAEPVAPAKVAETKAPVTKEPDDSAGLGGWLAIAGLAVVLAAAGAVAYVLIRDKKRLAAPDGDELDANPFEPTMEDRRRGSAVSLNPIPAPGGFDGQLIAESENASADELDQQGDLDSESESQIDEAEDESRYSETEYADAEETPLAHMPALEAEEAWHIETAEPEPSETWPALTPRPVEISGLSDDDLEPVDEVPTGEILTSRTWPRRASASEPALAPGQLAIFETSYSFGDDDFYHAFTIESPTHEFLGQCGIVISDVLGLDEGQLVDAFDIWLFETQGTRTLSKVLVSEQAYRDEGISAKLARKGELVVVQPGLVLELETESIRLTATVEDVAYRKGAPEARSVFDRLKIRMVVEQLS
jgi:hypothetical protein